MENYNKVEKGEIGTYYYLDNELHRIDGPAIVLNTGYKEWWFEDKLINCNSQEEFERLIKLKLFW